jgi:sulfate permease, SulP family
MSFTETIAAGRAFAKNEEPPPRPNAELLATGLANAGGALLGAMPGGGGTSQTAVNRIAGARTQLAELITAAATLATMLLLAPLIALMPQATLAAVVIVYSVGLIRPAEFGAILRIRRTEFTWALAAFAGVVLLGTLKGIIVAIIVSLVALACQAADPPVYVLGRKPGSNVFRPRSQQQKDLSCSAWQVLFNAQAHGGGLGSHKGPGAAVHQGPDPTAEGDRAIVCRRTLHEGDRGVAQPE